MRINQSAVSSYPHKLLVALDMFGAITDGMPYDITISTYVGMVRKGLPPQYMPNKQWKTKLCVWVANSLDRLQKDHCKEAMLADLQRLEEAQNFIVNLQDPT